MQCGGQRGAPAACPTSSISSTSLRCWASLPSGSKRSVSMRSPLTSIAREYGRAVLQHREQVGAVEALAEPEQQSLREREPVEAEHQVDHELGPGPRAVGRPRGARAGRWRRRSAGSARRPRGRRPPPPAPRAGGPARSTPRPARPASRSHGAPARPRARRTHRGGSCCSRPRSAPGPPRRARSPDPAGPRGRCRRS